MRIHYFLKLTKKPSTPFVKFGILYLKTNEVYASNQDCTFDSAFMNISPSFHIYIIASLWIDTNKSRGRGILK
jgi:hypothetical protein